MHVWIDKYNLTSKCTRGHVESAASTEETSLNLDLSIVCGHQNFFASIPIKVSHQRWWKAFCLVPKRIGVIQDMKPSLSEWEIPFILILQKTNLSGMATKTFQFTCMPWNCINYFQSNANACLQVRPHTHTYTHICYRRYLHFQSSMICMHYGKPWQHTNTHMESCKHTSCHTA